MIFSVKKQKPPVLGNTRTETKFAFLPVSIDAGFIWLGWYVEVYKYTLCWTRDFGTFKKDRGWVLIERKPK